MFSLMCVVCHAAGALKYDFVVDANGTGDFTSVQAAVNAVPDFRKAGPTKIFIKKGVYKEKIVIAETKQGVQFYGEEGTVITYDDYANKPNVFGENKGTSGSSTIYVFGPDFVAENITFENSSGPVGQAVAVQIGGDRAFFRKCRFPGDLEFVKDFSRIAPLRVVRRQHVPGKCLPEAPWS